MLNCFVSIRVGQVLELLNSPKKNSTADGFWKETWFPGIFRFITHPSMCNQWWKMIVLVSPSYHTFEVKLIRGRHRRFKINSAERISETQEKTSWRSIQMSTCLGLICVCVCPRVGLGHFTHKFRHPGWGADWTSGEHVLMTGSYTRLQTYLGKSLRSRVWICHGISPILSGSHLLFPIWDPKKWRKMECPSRQSKDWLRKFVPTSNWFPPVYPNFFPRLKFRKMRGSSDQNQLLIWRMSAGSSSDGPAFSHLRRSSNPRGSRSKDPQQKMESTAFGGLNCR